MVKNPSHNAGKKGQMTARLGPELHAEFMEFCSSRNLVAGAVIIDLVRNYIDSNGLRPVSEMANEVVMEINGEYKAAAKLKISEGVMEQLLSFCETEKGSPSWVVEAALRIYLREHEPPRGSLSRKSSARHPRGGGRSGTPEALGQ